MKKKSHSSMSTEIIGTRNGEYTTEILFCFGHQMKHRQERHMNDTRIIHQNFIRYQQKMQLKCGIKEVV